MATICVKEGVLPDGPIVLRERDERECAAAGLSGDAAVRASAGGSDHFDSIYAGENLACVWGYQAESLFSYRVRVWLLTCPEMDGLKFWFMRQSVRGVRYLFSLYDEIEVCVHRDHAPARKWLAWLGFESIGSHGEFIFMVLKKEGSRWVS